LRISDEMREEEFCENVDSFEFGCEYIDVHGVAPFV
jgi:hypothetical protein